MSRRSLTLDDALEDYVASRSVREHPVQIALREATLYPPFGRLASRAS